MTKQSWKMLNRRWISIVALCTLSLVFLPATSAAVRTSSNSSARLAVTTAILSEAFESGALPANWLANGTPGWRFDNPAARANTTGGTGKFAIADSDDAGTVAMNTELRTPALNLAAATGVKLTVKTDFTSDGISTADVDVSINNGTTWTNIWRQAASSFKGTVILNVPQAAGQSTVRFRFHYYNANYAYYWLVDDVLVESTAPPAAPSTLSATVAGNNVNLAWADNSSDEGHFVIEKSPNGSTGWVEAGQVGPNITTFTHLNVTCATTVFYRVKATDSTLQSGNSNSANITMPACPPAASGVNENFNASQNLPTGWTMPSLAWVFNQPNTVGTTGNAAFADAAGGTSTRELRTPVFSMAGTSAVLLTFQTDIKIYAGQSLAQDADVDISINGGTTWTNVWDKKAAYKGPVSIDLSPWAANQPSLIVRFRSILPYGGSYWQLDNVVIGAMSAPTTPTNVSATLNGGNDVLLGWSGGTGAKYTLERSANGGSTWTQIADLTDGATTYADTTVASSTAYQYRVRAYNAAGQSAFSATVSVSVGDKSVRYVDVTISLHAAAVLATAADRAKYENNIRYFADAVFEQSNGAHRLRKVTFYRNGAHFDSAHIQWIPTCHPNATLSGYALPGTGARMEFCDAFGDFLFLPDTAGQQGGGATIGHEWGHFFYGMPDEYSGSGTNTDPPGVTRADDINSSTSIMRYQWDGFTDLRFLNHTTAVTGFSLRTAAGRTYGAPAWEVLARPKNQDPQTGEAKDRPYWPELKPVAPAPGVAPRIDLPNAAARASLQIVWEPGFTTALNGLSAAQGDSHTTAREIVIDRSALMADSGHLDAVKIAVEHLIDQTPIGDSLGIIAFDGTANIVQPLTKIVDQTTKDTLITAVSGITVGNAQAAAGPALEMALAELTSTTGTTRTVYHITHGGDTTGSHAIMAAPDYEAAGIPLHIFGFDPHHGDETELRQLAELTKGEYTVVRTAAELETAFTHTNHDTSPHHDVTVAHAEVSIAASQTFTVPVVFDSTLSELDFDITYFAAPAAATVTLINSLGSSLPVNPADCETYGSGPDAHTTCHVEHQTPVGEWTLKVVAASDIHMEYHVTGITLAGLKTYDAVLSASDGDAVEYPQPIVMQASVHRSFPIGGLRAIGQVHEADGHVFSVVFNDDGHAPDNIADDGIYSAYVDYTEPGEHRISVQFDNFAGTGFYTDKSFGDVDDVPNAAVTEDFEREAHYQVSVLDWKEDDHTDWPGHPEQPPTALTVDNVQVHGRIDSAGDGDVFQITVPTDYAEPTLGIRINALGLGMDPDVVVFATDFARQYEHKLDHTPTSDDSLFFSIDVTPGETFYVEVLHLNGAATTGTYDISAGPHLWSDPLGQKRLSFASFLSVSRR